MEARLSEQNQRKPMGRPRKYRPEELRDSGAPKLNVRFDPRLYGHVQAQPQGPRAYLEALVTEDIGRTQPAESTSAGDVPGQLLLADHQKAKE